MRKSGLTGDEAYALSKRRGTSGDLGPLKKELSLLKEDLGNFKINNVAGKSVLLEQSISKKYVYFNTQYKLLGFGNNEYNTCKIYKIEKIRNTI